MSPSSIASPAMPRTPSDAHKYAADVYMCSFLRPMQTGACPALYPGLKLYLQHHHRFLRPALNPHYSEARATACSSDYPNPTSGSPSPYHRIRPSYAFLPPRQNDEQTPEGGRIHLPSVRLQMAPRRGWLPMLVGLEGG